MPIDFGLFKREISLVSLTWKHLLEGLGASRGGSEQELIKERVSSVMKGACD